MKTTKRNSIRQILNREKVYNLSDYARKTGKKIGRAVSIPEVRTCLSHMKKEGQLVYSIVNKRYVVGFTVKAAA